MFILNGPIGSTCTVTFPFAVPNNPIFLGAHIYNQFYVIENFAPLTLGLTNGGHGVIGG